MNEEQAETILGELNHREVEALFDQMENIQFWIKDSECRYLKINRAFLLNYSLARREDVLGLTDLVLSPPWLAEGFLKDDRRVLSGERIVNRIELVGGFDRAARWFRTTKIPVTNRAGHIAATAGITQPLPGVQAPEFPVPELAPALQALQDEPSASWNNATLAQMSGLSVSAFERKFRKHLQTSPMQFLKRLRLAKAAAALIQTGGSVSEIAAECGFSDQAHLSREFRKLFDSTPTKWRDRHSGM